MFKDLYLTLRHRLTSFLLVGILFLNALGIGLKFYEIFPWYDVVLHFLGGAWVALLVLNWPKFEEQFSTRKQKIIFILMVVLVVGLAWEIMELIIEGILYIKYYGGLVLKELKAGATPDSFFDLVMDVVGGLAASYWILTGKRFTK